MKQVFMNSLLDSLLRTAIQTLGRERRRIEPG